MSFQIKKPEIKSIPKAVWNTVKVRWQFWTILAIGFILGVILMVLTVKHSVDYARSLVIPFIIIFVYIYSFQNKIRTSFWKQIADINSWQYKHYGDFEQELGVMFRQGNNRHISHIIDGNIDGRSFRIFNYDFAVGSGKSKKTYHYTVFSFKFNGSFPHIYLNNRHNRYSVSVGEKIPLPGEFEKSFSLSAPKEYEIEALEIFTPEILARLLDGGFTYDIEFVDKEMLVFTDGLINNSEELIQKFNQALELEDLFDEKLDKFKFQPIGDMPYSL